MLRPETPGRYLRITADAKQCINPWWSVYGLETLLMFPSSHSKLQSWNADCQCNLTFANRHSPLRYHSPFFTPIPMPQCPWCKKVCRQQANIRLVGCSLLYRSSYCVPGCVCSGAIHHPPTMGTKPLLSWLYCECARLRCIMPPTN